ncbi:MAG: hypothetical protein IPJ02_08555 [Chitinophagaceae bacterium]|nr:hypothetical protein [Chitinophagaceae bacterium]
MGSDLDTLITILIKPAAEENKTMCVFDPHHTIFLIKNGITSYIDFCFTCMQFESSNDLGSLVFFDEDKWFALERFFKQMGVRYEQYPKYPE